MSGFRLSAPALEILARSAPAWLSALRERPLDINPEFALHYFRDVSLGAPFGQSGEPVRLNYVRVQQPDTQPHVHFKTTEVFLVLEEEAIFVAGKDEVAVKPGDVLVVPCGQPHYFRDLKGAEVHCFNLQIGPILDAQGREDFARWDQIQPSCRPFRAAFPEGAFLTHIDLT